MTSFDLIRRLWDHLLWADSRIAVVSSSSTPDAQREFAHLLGAEATWLARLEDRTPPTAVWPDLSPEQVDSLRVELEAGYKRLLTALDEADLDRAIDYTNSAGRHFQNTVAEILIHVALHGQYHRGKINLLVREQGDVPVPVDFILYARNR